MHTHTQTIRTMRTKALILSAAVTLAAVASTMAQTTNVYSVNAVGYVTLSVPANSFSLIANPLNQATNNLDTIIPNVPVNTTKAFLWDPASSSFTVITKRSFGWSDLGANLFNPGTGFFIQNLATTNISFSLVGEVPQGVKTNTVVSGFNLVAPQFPIAGAVETQLGLPAVQNDNLYQYDVPSQSYTVYTRRSASWTGGAGEPNIGVAEGFFWRVNTGTNWVNTFSANN